MRILHFGKFPAHRFGGIERHVEGLVQGLAKAGLDVTNLVYDLGGSSASVCESTCRGVRIVAVPCRRTVASLPIAPQTPLVVRRMAKAAPFDIVHAHFPDPLAFASMPFAPGAARIASWHSDIVRQRAFGSIYATIARTCFAPLDAVIAATPLHLESAQLPAFRPRRTRLIPYGVDLSRFTPTPATMACAANLRAAAGGRVIVFSLGRHVYYKGFEVLIAAMQNVDALLLLGGEGPLTPALQARARQSKGLGEVRLVGRIGEDELAAYYHACSIYCLPSVAPSEAFGLVQIEAMACAKPVVNCLLNNGVNFVSPDGVSGLTVTPGDPVALAAALNRLLLDAGLRETLGRNGQRRVAEHFSMDAMIAATIDLYRNVLDARR